MILYILYIEPLLLRLERELHGVKMASFDQIDEDFCDDISIITENDDDIILADVIISEFEQVSGAILNRSEKTKVMGIGDWADQEIWTIPWLKVVKELKIYGFIITPVYERTVSRNWENLVKQSYQCSYLMEISNPAIVKNEIRCDKNFRYI